jgi:hypothetical protein
MIFITRSIKAKSMIVSFLLDASRVLAADESSQPQNTPAPPELQYTLVNATPIDLSAAYNTYHPSRSDSPFIGDADVSQIKSGELDWRLDTEKSVAIHDWIVGNPEFKLGLTNWMGVQIFPQFYSTSGLSGSGFGKSIEQDGFGDTTVRLKINFLSNESGRLAIGLLSALKIPTGTGNQLLERHFLLPVNYSLSQGFALFAKPQIDIFDQAHSNSTRVQWHNSVGLSHTITGNLSWYTEFCDLMSSELGFDALGTGFTYRITPSFSVDANSFFGLTGSVSDHSVFTSFSYTF